MRSIHCPAAVLVLLLSACEKKSEPAHGESNSERPAKPTRTERPERSEDELDPKVSLREALDTAEKEGDPAAREKALAAVAWDGIDVDRELAQKAFAGLTPGGEAARRLVAHFAMRMADDDPEAALEWARGLEQAEERSDAISRIAVVISTSDPKRAAALATDEVPEGLMRDRASVQIVQRWSQSAPADAAQWVATFPEGKARQAALESLAGSWLGADAPAFATWASKEEAQLPELATAVAGSIRVIPDEAVRAKRLAALDEAFRQHVEEALKKMDQVR
jgi:hypothetical protein